MDMGVSTSLPESEHHDAPLRRDYGIRAVENAKILVRPKIAGMNGAAEP